MKVIKIPDDQVEKFIVSVMEYGEHAPIDQLINEVGGSYNHSWISINEKYLAMIITGVIALCKIVPVSL